MLDDEALHLVELSERAAARLQNQAARSDFQANRPDIGDPSEVSFAKRLFGLEAHILWNSGAG